LGNGREQELSKTSKALSRLGVGVLSAATISTGFTALATSASADTPDITALSIAPASATISTGEDTCQLYTITATEPTGKTNGNVTVVLQPTGGVDAQFCSGGAGIGAGGASATGGAGAQEARTFTLSSNAVTIGVNEVTAAPGQIAISAFPQNGTNATPASGAPTASAIENINTAAAQNDVVTTLSASPSNQIGTPGGTVHFTVTTTNGASSVVSGAQVYYTVKSSQGNSTGQDNQACGALTGQMGTVDCAITVPATTSVQSGPYTVTFKVPQNATGQTNGSAAGVGGIPPTNAGPTTTATITTATSPAGNETVGVACGDSTTARDATNDCFVPLSQKTISFTATVTTPTGTGGAAVPESNVQVTWSITGNPCCPPVSAGNTTANNSNLNPQTCVTDASGKCTTTLTFTGTPADGDQFQVTATLTNGRNGSAFVTQTNQTQRRVANNIKLAAANASPKTGSADVLTATVTDQFGQSANDQAQVTFTVTGAGTFSNGTTQQTVTADNTGHAQVTLVSGSAGTSNVTASLNPTQTNCETTAANNGGTAGNCSATTSVTWSKSSTTTTGRQGVSVKLACFSHRAHRVTCVAQLSKNIGGVTVVFWDNHGNKIGTDVTNRFGHARVHLHGLKSHVKHRYQAHAKKSSKTRSAWSRFATVFVK